MKKVTYHSYGQTLTLDSLIAEELHYFTPPMENILMLRRLKVSKRERQRIE